MSMTFECGAGEAAARAGAQVASLDVIIDEDARAYAANHGAFQRVVPGADWLIDWRQRRVDEDAAGRAPADAVPERSRLEDGEARHARS